MNRVLGLLLGALVLAAVACSGSGKVSVSARSANAADAASPGTLDLGNGIQLSRVRLAIRKISLEGEVTPSGALPDAGTGQMVAATQPVADDGDRGRDHPEDDDADENENEDENEDEDEVNAGPFLVDLSGDQLTGGIKHVFDAEVPAGTFHELKVVIGVVPPARAGDDAALAAMNGESVIVDGTIDGAPFSFQSRLHAAQKQEMTIVVAPGGTSSNVTLSIDPTGWFTAADGSRLDPSAPASKARIEGNIRRSVRAFSDRDRDGEDDDDHGHDGRGHD